MRKQNKVTGKANIKLLKNIKERILAKPDLFIMEDWQEPTQDECGTACCIGGYALAEKGILYKPLTSHQAKETNDLNDSYFESGDYAWTNNKKAVDYNNFEPQDEAQRILELDDAQTAVLFMVDNWPEQFRDAWNSSDLDSLRAHIAAARIDHFIETGE